MEDIIERRVSQKKYGFGAEKKKSEKIYAELIRKTETEDLIKFGLIPEFIGRLPVIATLDELDEPSLVRILTEPKNAITKQYMRLFEFEKVKLQFTQGALEAIARETIRRKTGARGLRAILERIMLDVMYETPSQSAVREVLINEEVITKNMKPVVVFEKQAVTA